MPKYQIIEQEIAIGWKEDKEIGKPTKVIVEYDSLPLLLEGEGFFDENYDEENEGEYCRMITAIIDNGGFMCNQYDKSYWEEPEPCDSYLTYGTKYEIKELSEKEADKIEYDKNKKILAEKEANNKKWKNLKGKLTDSEFIDKLMSEYKFPSKIKV